MSHGIYEQLGLRPVVNAAGTLTRVGGTLMLPEVVEAMTSAAGAFVKIDELQARAGALIADATGAESGYVVCGAAAGVMLSTAAAMAGTDPARVASLPDTEGLANEVVMQRGHRLDYDNAVRGAGARIVEIGFPGETLAWELEHAIGERTAAVLHVANRPAGPLPLATVTEIAHARAVPVIVDAAAALPPAENLRRFVAEGADAVVFSGGKALRGPQASSIVAARQHLVDAMALAHQDMDVREVTRLSPFAAPGGRPYHGIGRPLKVGKEEIVGVLAALRAFRDRDHDADLRRLRDDADWLCARLTPLAGMRPDVRAQGPGRPLPVVHVAVEEDTAGLSAAEIVVRLEDGDPRICVNDAPVLDGAFVLNPFSLQPGEPQMVAERIEAVLSGGRR